MPSKWDTAPDRIQASSGRGLYKLNISHDVELPFTYETQGTGWRLMEGGGQRVAVLGKVTGEALKATTEAKTEKIVKIKEEWTTRLQKGWWYGSMATSTCHASPMTWVCLRIHNNSVIPALSWQDGRQTQKSPLETSAWRRRTKWDHCLYRVGDNQLPQTDLWPPHPCRA